MGFWSNIFGKGGSYFLDEESAKGLGDTEYMKQVKTIRRTYPGGGGEEEFEVVKQISAMSGSTFESRDSSASRPASTPSYQSSSSFGGASSFGGSNFGSTSQPAEASEASSTEEVAQAPSFKPRRDTKVNTDMDLFRNMAKKVGR